MIRPLLFLLALLTGAAGAQGFGFAPTAMNVNTAGPLNTETTMVNTTRTAAKFTVLVRAWAMKDGETVLSETRDLIVNPTTFTIAPGGSQVIRVGLRKKPGDQELTYRIFVQQAPLEGSMEQITSDLGDGRTAKLDLAIAFSLPVYVAAPNAKAAVAHTVSRDGKDLLLEMRNSGNRHATYGSLSAKRSGDAVAVQGRALLAGANHTLRLPGLAEQTGPLVLTYRNADGETVSETLPVP